MSFEKTVKLQKILFILIGETLSTYIINTIGKTKKKKILSSIILKIL